MDYNLNEISLSDKVKKIVLEKNYSYITIKKIMIPSLIGNVNWVNEISQKKLKLIVKAKGTSNIENTFELNFLSLITPQSINPIFETFIEIPKEHANSPTSFGNYYTDIELKLKQIKGVGDEDLEVILLCSVSPGVKFVE